MITIKKIMLLSSAGLLLLYCSYNINRQPETCKCRESGAPPCIELQRAAGDQISYYQNPLDSEVMRDYYNELKKKCCAANNCCKLSYNAQVVQNESHAEVS